MPRPPAPRRGAACWCRGCGRRGSRHRWSAWRRWGSAWRLVLGFPAVQIAAMHFASPLIRGTLLRRYKRFLADVMLEDGREVVAHCANPGGDAGAERAGDDGLAGAVERSAAQARLRLAAGRAAPAGTSPGSTPGCRTGWSPRRWRRAQCRRWPGTPAVRPEVRYGTASRVDFLLTGAGAAGRLCRGEERAPAARGGLGGVSRQRDGARGATPARAGGRGGGRGAGRACSTWCSARTAGGSGWRRTSTRPMRRRRRGACGGGGGAGPRHPDRRGAASGWTGRCRWRTERRPRELQ